MQIKLIRKARRSVASLSRDTAIVCGVVALLVFVTFVTTVAIVAKGTTREKVVYNPAIWREQPRLSDVAIPLKYNITLTIDLRNDKFGGVEDIVVNITEDRVSLIVLHIRDLNVTTVNIYRVPDDAKEKTKKVHVPRFHPWSKNSYFVMYLDEYISTGLYNINIMWHAELKPGYTGLYLNDMKLGNDTNPARKLVSSQLQASHAREIFPCFDEPDLKAEFHMTIEVESIYKTVLWNTEEVEKNTRKGLNSSLKDDKRDATIYKFRKSPIMSTYLLAFVVGNLNSKTTTYKAKDGRTVTINAWGRDDLAETSGEYALNISTKTLKFFEDYYDEDYPLTKCDMVGVPSFQAGAMENWGLVIYKERYLFYNQEKDKTSVKGLVNMVVAHELAHMWFGNLVTMKWWNDIWLNEGFATYAQGLATSKTGDWNNKGFLMEETRKRALEMDVFTSSRPASLPESAVDPDEAHNYFDTIAYNKGATILNQLNMVLTKEIFSAGLQNYIDTFKGSNANQTQLWEILDKASDFKATRNFSLGSFMDTWTLQMNLPVVSIEQFTSDKFILTQKRFLITDDHSEDSTSPYNYQWYIPIRARFYGNEKETYEGWIEPNSELELKVKSLNDNDFWFINTDGDGYYITRYSLKLWDRLIVKIPEADLSIRDTLVLLQDTDYLVQAGYYPIERQIELLEVILKQSTNYNEINEILSQISAIQDKLEKSTDEDAMTKWLDLWKESLEGLAKKYVNSESDTFEEKLLSSAIFKACSNMNIQYCLDAAKGRWDKRETEDITADDKSTVYVVTMRRAGNQTKQWEEFQKMYLESNSETEQDILKDVLAATTKAVLIERYINMSMDGSMIQPGEGLYIMGRSIAPASNLAANISTWFMLNNFDKIMETFQGIDLARRDYVRRVVSLAPGDLLTRVFEDFESPTDGFLTRHKNLRNDYLIGKSNALSRVSWISKYKDSIKEYTD